MASSSDSNDESDEQLEGTLKLTINKIDSSTVVSEEQTQNFAKLEWMFTVKTECSQRTSSVKHLDVYLECNSRSESLLWSCDCNVEFVLLNQRVLGVDDFTKTMKHDYTYDEDGNNSRGYHFKKWVDVINPDNGFVKNNCIMLEARVKINKIQGFRVSPSIDFKQTYPCSDGILVIDGVSVHVVKSYLAIYSPFFSSLFNDNLNESKSLNENGQVEGIPVEGVVLEEFVELLRVIYPSHKTVTAKNVEYILKLADKFQMQNVVDQCEQFLITTEDVPLIKKLLFAGQYCLSKLEDVCIKKLTTVAQIVELKKGNKEDFKNLNDKTKVALLEKMIKLSG